MTGRGLDLQTFPVTHLAESSSFRLSQRVRNYLSEGRDVCAYFNNDEAGHAVQNALDLRRYVED